MTPISRNIHLKLALLLATALILAACGGATTEEPPAAAPADTDAPTAAPTVTDAPAATEAEDEEDTDDSSGASVLVEISGHSFTPENITISVGTTVNWLHQDGDFNHTVTADDGSFASGIMGQNDRFSFTFDTPGTYAYYCEFHGGAGGAGMSGVITVEE